MKTVCKAVISDHVSSHVSPALQVMPAGQDVGNETTELFLPGNADQVFGLMGTPG
jgi:hypothetical protein